MLTALILSIRFSLVIYIGASGGCVFGAGRRDI